jgi:hypothetical protein
MSTKQTDPKSPAKSASITLRANGTMLLLLATLKENGTVVTQVTTRDAEKKTTRGMTQSHKSMDVARAHLEALAKAAEKAGWVRGKFAAPAKPDAFSQLPAPPKANAA